MRWIPLMLGFIFMLPSAHAFSVYEDESGIKLRAAGVGDGLGIDNKKLQALTVKKQEGEALTAEEMQTWIALEADRAVVEKNFNFIWPMCQDSGAKGPTPDCATLPPEQLEEAPYADKAPDKSKLWTHGNNKLYHYRASRDVRNKLQAQSNAIEKKWNDFR